MFKNLKKVLFALVLALVTVFAFACGEDVVEANKENCKDFCDTCPTCNPEANEENCKDFCETCPTCPEINDEACEDYQDFVAPESFYMDVPNVKVGETTEIYLDEFDPEDAYQGLIYVSSNPEIATVSADGVVTGVRPGECTITATSVLDPEVSEEYTFEVEDALSDLEVLARELAYLKAQLPSYVSETYEFPKPWNTNVEVTWNIDGTAAADGKLVVENLAHDVKNNIVLSVSYNGESDQATGIVIWSVKDANVNCFTRVQKAQAAAEALVAQYAQGGVKVSEDIVLPAVIFGCEMNWASTNTAVLATDGTYTRPLDDKKVNLSIAATYREKIGVDAQGKDIFIDNIGKGSYDVVVKGYSAEEKADYIMANLFANLNGKEVNTDLVLPEFDNLFGAKLSYESKDTAVYGNDGKLVAAVTEAKEVKFEVTIKYDIAGNAADNFEAKKELVVKAVPATKASEAVQAWLATDAGKVFGKVAHTPYGTEAGNVLALPTEGYAWNVEAVKLAVKNQAEDEDLYQVFALEDGKVKLNAQYLRYTLVNLTGVYTAEDGSKANVNLFLNIGVAETPMVVYTGTWRSSAQKDSSLSEIQGKYDLTSNVSYFDQKVGNISETYGSGYWSGYVMTATDANGQVWKSYVMELMTAYIVLDEEGKAVYDVKNLSGGNGGNWGVFFVNNTGEAVNIEVGTYGVSNYTLADGSVIGSVGSRNNLAIDGYAPAFIVDGEGNVIHKSTDDKLEYNMENNKAIMGGKQYKAGDVVDASLFAGMADEFKFEGETALWETLYTAADNFAFEAKADGTFKKEVAEDGTETYVAIAEGEEVAEADRYAPKYAKGAALTAAEYEALADAEKALVTLSYKATKAIDFTVKNLVGDSAKGSLVHYLTIPAGGYAMSWKYQFYGVGSPVTLRPFTQGDKVTVEKYDVHYLSSQDGTNAAKNLANAQATLALADTTKNATAETYVINAKTYYGKLAGATKADVFAEADLVAAEDALVALVDAEIEAFLASEATAKPAEFAQTLGKMNNRFAKYPEDLLAKVTKYADFAAKFEEYGAIDLTITYDYKGGYAQGFILETQKEVAIAAFMADFYAHMVANGAFGETVPTLEVFSSIEYWSTNYAQYAETPLGKYLFTPYSDGTNVNENYRDVIEGSDKFANTEAGQKWLPLLDWVNEAVQYANGSGQDFWGRKDLPYAKYELLAKQTYVPASYIKDHSTVTVTNSGTLLGAYRFAQYICGSIVDQSNVYRNYVPNKVWSSVFDRQTTQELYGSQVYHCTDGTVKLLDEPFKEGYKFLGWVLEDGSPAEITGATFADVTVYAKWAANVEGAVEAEVGKDLTPVYYGDKGTGVGPYMSATPAGDSIDVQAANVGVGGAAVVVGDKLFPLPAYALIEVGKDATEAATLDKAALQPYGSDADTNNSTGLRYDATTNTVVNGDSYGHGAMYYNAGQFDLTFELSDCYGRIIGGAAYGYHKYLFTYDAENSKYVAKLVGGAAGSFTLKPGEYLWCPMTAERFCTGLTDCDGTSGVVGVLSDGVEAQVVRISIAQDIPFYTVKFYDGEKLVSEQYLEQGNTAISKPADLELAGYVFKGWATSAESTEVVEVPAEATADVTYYAVFEKAEKFDAVTVDANLAEATPQVYKTLAEGLNHLNDGGTMTVKAGKYDESLTIDKPVTIVGANISTILFATDTFEANEATDSIVTGGITIAAGVNGVVISGLVMNNQVSLKGNENVTVKKVVFTKVKADATLDGAVRIQGASKDVVVDTCYFAAGQANRGIHINAVTTNFTVENCIVLDEAKATVYDFVRFGQNNTANAAGTVVMRNNYVTSIQSGIMDRVPAASKYIIEGNTFKSIPAAIYMRAATVANIEYVCQYNEFDGCGDLVADWDVTAFTTSETTSVKVNYNAFINNFPTEGTKTDYIIKVRTAVGTIDCSNNYFDKEDQKEKNLNATGLTYLASYDEFKAARIAKLGVSTIEEVYEELLKDLYAYLKGDNAEFETFETFKAGFDTNWAAGSKYGTYDDKLYAANKKDVVDDALGTFANSTAYSGKWMEFFNAMDAVVADVNSSQSMWASAYTGLMRMRNYFGKGTYQTPARDAMLIEGLNKGIVKE